MRTYIYATLFLLLDLNLLCQKAEWAKIYNTPDETIFPYQLETSENKNLALLAGNKGLLLNYLDSSGNLLWTSQITAQNINHGSIAFDKSNSVFLRAGFTDSLRVDSTVITGKNSSFITKYNANGNRDWLKVFYNIDINDLTVDKDNFLYLLITLKDTVDLFNKSFSPLGKADLLLAKLDSNHNLIYTRQLKGNAKGLKIRVSEQKNIFVYGVHTDSLFIGNTAYDWSHKGSADDFVLKMDQNGSALTFSHSCNDYYGYSIDFACHDNENFAVAGIWCHQTCYRPLEIFNSQGSLSTKTEIPNGNFYNTNATALAYTDSSGLWAFSSEVHYNGHPSNPATTSSQNLGLTQFSNRGNQITREIINLPGGSNVIAGGENNSVYIADFVKPGTSFNIQDFSLQNSSKKAGFFIAKYKGSKTPVSVQENTISDHNFSVYPNPASGSIIFHCSSGKKQISLYTSLGKCIYTRTENSTSGSLDLSSYVSGIYFLKVEGESFDLVRKIIIE